VASADAETVAADGGGWTGAVADDADPDEDPAVDPGDDGADESGDDVPGDPVAADVPCCPPPIPPLPGPRVRLLHRVLGFDRIAEHGDELGRHLPDRSQIELVEVPFLRHPGVPPPREPRFHPTKTPGVGGRLHRLRPAGTRCREGAPIRFAEY
jgi:hypothetical protein